LLSILPLYYLLSLFLQSDAVQHAIDSSKPGHSSSPDPDALPSGSGYPEVGLLETSKRNAAAARSELQQGARKLVNMFNRKQDAPSSASASASVLASASGNVARPLSATSTGGDVGLLVDVGGHVVRRVRALYPFAASGPNELSFKEGDVLTVEDTSPEDWWYATNAVR